LDLFESLILGLVQGLTEFLPVSSSGHLVIVEGIFGIKSDDIVFEILVHLGTLLAVLVYFRKKITAIIAAVISAIFNKSARIQNPDLKLAVYLIVGTVPAVIIGFAFKNLIIDAFDSPRWASAMLLVTALILFSTRWTFDKSKPNNNLRSLAIGCAQALAIMPGISRSGSTISMGMWLGMNKSEAAEFSFLLSIPAIAGASILEIPQMISKFSVAGSLPVYLAGALVAAVIGYLSIAYLLTVIKKGKFFYFGLYCLLVGFLGIFLL
jgi:undecaprenyl-diphosphatase